MPGRKAFDSLLGSGRLFSRTARSPSRNVRLRFVPQSLLHHSNCQYLFTRFSRTAFPARHTSHFSRISPIRRHRKHALRRATPATATVSSSFSYQKNMPLFFRFSQINGLNNLLGSLRYKFIPSIGFARVTYHFFDLSSENEYNYPDFIFHSQPSDTAEISVGASACFFLLGKGRIFSVFQFAAEDSPSRSRGLPVHHELRTGSAAVLARSPQQNIRAAFQSPVSLSGSLSVSHGAETRFSACKQ